MKNLESQIKAKASLLSLDKLKEFYITCPDNISHIIINEIESRMEEKEFIKYCNEF